MLQFETRFKKCIKASAKEMKQGVYVVTNIRKVWLSVFEQKSVLGHMSQNLVHSYAAFMLCSGSEHEHFTIC